MAPNLHQIRAIFDVDLRAFVAKRAATAAKTCASASRVLQHFRNARRMIFISFCARRLQIWRRICTEFARFSTSTCAFSSQNAQRPLQELARVRCVSCNLFHDARRCELHFILRAALANLPPNLHQTRAIVGVDLHVFVAKRAATAARTCAGALRVLQSFS